MDQTEQTNGAEPNNTQQTIQDAQTTTPTPSEQVVIMPSTSETPTTQPSTIEPPEMPTMPIGEQYTQPIASQPPQQNTQPTSPTNNPVAGPVSPGLIVLQWLTYAFWGWTVLALSALTSSVLASFISKADTGGFTPYGIAAILVLLPLSFVCDLFYSKQEPEKKTGVAMAVMIIHAVIFALFGIGSLIVAVITMVMLATTSSTDKTGIMVGLYSALIIAIYYAATFLRTLNPPRLNWIQKYYKMFMLISVGIIAILGIAGPVAKERSTRDDKLIVSGIYNVETAIDRYARSNSKLPDNLDTLGLDGDAKKLVEKDLVKYSQQTAQNNYTSSSSYYKTYYYQLCVTYKDETSGYAADTYRYGTNTDSEYSTYISAYSHPSGEVCYKLKTT